MKIRYLVALALLAFFFSMLLGAPPALLNAWLHTEKGANSLRFYGVHGTVAEGGFASLTVNNRPALTDAHWRLKPLWLALLRLSVDVDTGGDARVHVNVSRAIFGKLRLADFTATGNVKALLALLGQANLPLEGQADVNLPLMRADAGIPVEVRGNVQISNLVWTLAKDPLPLGTFSANLSTDDKGILVSLDSGPGPLEMSGTITLSRDHAYDAHVQLRPRPDAPPALVSLVRSLGNPDAQGWYPLRRTGNLAPAAPAPAASAAP